MTQRLKHGCSLLSFTLLGGRFKEGAQRELLTGHNLKLSHSAVGKLRLKTQAAKSL